MPHASTHATTSAYRPPPTGGLAPQRAMVTVEPLARLRHDHDHAMITATPWSRPRHGHGHAIGHGHAMGTVTPWSRSPSCPLPHDAPCRRNIACRQAASVAGCLRHPRASVAGCRRNQRVRTFVERALVCACLGACVCVHVPARGSSESERECLGRTLCCGTCSTTCRPTRPPPRSTCRPAIARPTGPFTAQLPVPAAHAQPRTP